MLLVLITGKTMDFKIFIINVRIVMLFTSLHETSSESKRSNNHDFVNIITGVLVWFFICYCRFSNFV